MMSSIGLSSPRKTLTYWSESSGGHQDGYRAGEHDIRGEAERSGPVQPRRHLQRVFTAVYSYLIGGYTEDGARFFLEMHNGRTIGNRPKLEHGKVIS